ncbi:unnamed protein product [Darwinula stevensoni]|uniref:Uncharacterized protein n=1 Tax=Darwinula stevensoni TaxID=69355 RepID=A0A7R8X878_9CRUS|nr:unnamed protein product [Darwinula stevensoni]CAG0884155.1 unnamed protein product [Darwinula stevensoni]
MKRSVGFLVLSLAMSLAQRQIATIYDRVNSDESGAWSERDDYCPNFLNCDPNIGDDMISSSCIVGAWIFYSEYSYNYEGVGTVEWNSGDGKCWNLQFNNQVSSMRYAGDTLNWKADTMNIYELELFSGLEFYAVQDVPQLPEQLTTVGSLIITGRSDWTIYTQPNFGGAKLCIGMQDGQFVGFGPHLSQFDVPTVGSFRLGCFAERKMLLDSGRHGVGVQT